MANKRMDLFGRLVGVCTVLIFFMSMELSVTVAISVF